MNLAATRRAAAHVAAVGGHELWLAPLLRRRPWFDNMASWQRHSSAALASWFVVASCQRHSAAAFSYGSAWWCLQRHLIITPIPGGGDEPAPLVSLAIDVTPRRLAVLTLQVDTVAAVVVEVGSSSSGRRSSSCCCTNNCATASPCCHCSMVGRRSLCWGMSLPHPRRRCYCCSPLRCLPSSSSSSSASGNIKVLASNGGGACVVVVWCCQ